MRLETIEPTVSSEFLIYVIKLALVRGLQYLELKIEGGLSDTSFKMFFRKKKKIF